MNKQCSNELKLDKNDLSLNETYYLIYFSLTLIIQFNNVMFTGNFKSILVHVKLLEHRVEVTIFLHERVSSSVDVVKSFDFVLHLVKLL